MVNPWFVKSIALKFIEKSFALGFRNHNILFAEMWKHESAESGAANDPFEFARSSKSDLGYF